MKPCGHAAVRGRAAWKGHARLDIDFEGYSEEPQ